jgi:hypothetical protein
MCVLQTVIEAAQEAKEQAALDQQEIDELTGGASMNLQPVSAEELESAQLRWTENNKLAPEAYDYDFVLTSVQSRLEALQARGYVLTVADKQATKALVQAAKEAKTKAATEAIQKRREDEARAAKVLEQQQESDKAKKKVC